MCSVAQLVLDAKIKQVRRDDYIDNVGSRLGEYLK
jgi:hypothetical protein